MIRLRNVTLPEAMRRFPRAYAIEQTYDGVIIFTSRKAYERA